MPGPARAGPIVQRSSLRMLSDIVVAGCFHIRHRTTGGGSPNPISTAQPVIDDTFSEMAMATAVITHPHTIAFFT